MGFGTGYAVVVARIIPRRGGVGSGRDTVVAVAVVPSGRLGAEEIRARVPCSPADVVDTASQSRRPQSTACMHEARREAQLICSSPPASNHK